MFFQLFDKCHYLFNTDPENVQIVTFIGQFKPLFKYLEKKKSSTLQVGADIRAKR